MPCFKKRVQCSGRKMVVRKHDGGLFGIFWGTWDDFWQETSISGANNAGKARSYPYVRRCCWTVLFIFFMAITVLNVLGQFMDYYDYPVSYSVFVQHENMVSK